MLFNLSNIIGTSKMMILNRQIYKYVDSYGATALFFNRDSNSALFIKAGDGSSVTIGDIMRLNDFEGIKVLEIISGNDLNSGIDLELKDFSNLNSNVIMDQLESIIGPELIVDLSSLIA